MTDIYIYIYIDVVVTDEMVVKLSGKSEFIVLLFTFIIYVILVLSYVINIVNCM